MNFPPSRLLIPTVSLLTLALPACSGGGGGGGGGGDAGALTTFVEVEPNNDIADTNANGTVATVEFGDSYEILGTIAVGAGEFDVFRHEVPVTSMVTVEVIPSSGIADLVVAVAADSGAVLAGPTNDFGPGGTESVTLMIDPAVHAVFHVSVWTLVGNSNYTVNVSAAMPVVVDPDSSTPSIQSTQHAVVLAEETPRVELTHEQR